MIEVIRESKGQKSEVNINKSNYFLLKVQIIVTK